MDFHVGSGMAIIILFDILWSVLEPFPFYSCDPQRLPEGPWLTLESALSKWEWLRLGDGPFSPLRGSHTSGSPGSQRRRKKIQGTAKENRYAPVFIRWGIRITFLASPTSFIHSPAGEE